MSPFGSLNLLLFYFLEKSDIYKIVNMVMEKVYEPAIFFTFGRRECENLAMQVNHLDLTGGKICETLIFTFLIFSYFHIVLVYGT